MGQVAEMVSENEVKAVAHLLSRAVHEIMGVASGRTVHLLKSRIDGYSRVWGLTFPIGGEKIAVIDAVLFDDPADEEFKQYGLLTLPSETVAAQIVDSPLYAALMLKFPARPMFAAMEAEAEKLNTEEEV